jgi:glycosyltransferase involved in cell wall biosynthesis
VERAVNAGRPRARLTAAAGDDAALAQGVLRLAAAPGLRAAMGERGRRKARDHFAEDRMQDGYARLYREMLRP